jgi:AcrR family transcriptional regulator
MEDIARAAGVSSPTAYNHFPGGKQQLMGLVYRPLIDPLLEAADQAIRNEDDPTEAAVHVVSTLVAILKEHQQLSIALAAAAIEQALKAAWPTNVDPNDIRVLVPLSAPLAQVIEYGQLRGDFHRYPAAGDVSNYHTNAILLRVFAQPNEPTQDTARIALSQLMAALLRSQ